MDELTKKGGPKFPIIKLLVAHSTSTQVAQLRAIYTEQGRDFTSLGQVVKDAVFHFWQHMTTIHQVPANWEDYRR